MKRILARRLPIVLALLITLTWSVSPALAKTTVEVKQTKIDLPAAPEIERAGTSATNGGGDGDDLEGGNLGTPNNPVPLGDSSNKHSTSWMDYLLNLVAKLSLATTSR